MDYVAVWKLHFGQNIERPVVQEKRTQAAVEQAVAKERTAAEKRTQAAVEQAVAKERTAAKKRTQGDKEAVDKDKSNRSNSN